MDKANIELAQLLISKSYVQQGAQSLQQRQNLIRDILSQRKLPKNGWDDESINFLITELSLMDSNNFISNIGMGEREGRVFSKLVKARNYSLSHGIGRSGELFAEQPKAAGSSILVKLAHFLALDSLKISGMKVSGCLIVPCATGMTLSLTLMTLLQKNPLAKYVVWPRIDQKTCLKCIITAGLIPLVVPNVLENDELRTDLVAMENIIKDKQTEILCVLSTTSCFAPRAPDKIVEISKLCKIYNIGHVINNAYGVQCYNYSKLINDALNKGRVDAIVQSTDKNYMVPVGGAIVASNDKDLLNNISQLYPGRASISPILDLFITLLSLGSIGLSNLLNTRQELMSYLNLKLNDFAIQQNERLLDTKNNPISIAMTLSNIPREHVSYLGSMLFSRFISGTRIGVPDSKKTVCNILFNGYGTHFDNYPYPYLNIACAIGIQRDEIDLFLEKLKKIFIAFHKYISDKVSKKEEETETEKSNVEEKTENTNNISL